MKLKSLSHIPVCGDPITSRSDRRRLRIVADGLVELPQLELVEIALRDLADDAGRLASDDCEAWDDHVGGHDCAIENAHVVFDYGKLIDDGVVTDVDVGADSGGLDDGALSDKDVIPDSQGHVGEGTFIHASGRAQTAAFAEETVAANGDGGIAGGRRA